MDEKWFKKQHIFGHVNLLKWIRNMQIRGLYNFLHMGVSSFHLLQINAPFMETEENVMRNVIPTSQRPCYSMVFAYWTSYMKIRNLQLQ